MRRQKFSMWLRAICGAVIIVAANYEQSNLLFFMGMVFMLSACLLAIAITIGEPA